MSPLVNLIVGLMCAAVAITCYLIHQYGLGLLNSATAILNLGLYIARSHFAR